MAHRKVVVVWNSLTGVPADRQINTFHFTTTTPSNLPSTVLELEAMRDAVIEFFTADTDRTTVGGAAGGEPLTKWFAGIVLSPTIQIRIYRCETEVAVGASAEPIIVYEHTIGGLATMPNTQPLPEEVSCCASFMGTPDSGYPIARQRGRIYLPTLLNQVLVVAGARTTVGLTTRQDIAASMKRLALEETAGIDWVVWSHTGLQAFPVTRGWVDDAFDSQRRRGPEASARTPWGLP